MSGGSEDSLYCNCNCYRRNLDLLL